MVEFDRVEEIDEVPEATGDANEAPRGKRVYSAGRTQRVHPSDLEEPFTPQQDEAVCIASSSASTAGATAHGVLDKRIGASSTGGCRSVTSRNPTADGGANASAGSGGDGGLGTRPPAVSRGLKRAEGAEASFMRRTSNGFLRSPTTARLVDKRQETFVARHGIVTALRIQQEAERVKQHLSRSGQLGHTFVLNPEKNRLLGRWDVLQALALVYTATLTPFETCFVPPAVGSASWTDPWFLINRVLDVIFFIDLCLQFFVAYQVGNDYGGRTWVLSHRRIIRHYLQGWFPLDASTLVVPCTFDIYLASSTFDGADVVSNVGGGGEEAAAGASGLGGRMSMLRVLRVLRLVKLVRLIRASRLVDRWKARIPPLTYAHQTVLRCVLLLLLSSHWYACIIALSAGLHASIDETWVGQHLYGLCQDDRFLPKPLRAEGAANDVDGLGHRMPLSMPLPGCPNLGIGSWYLAALSWAVLILTGSGGTDFYPSASSDYETLVVTILVLVGSFIWTTVLAAFCDVATNSNPALTAFRQNLDGLNLFISINALPRDMALRLRSFMHQQKGVQLREDAKRAMPRLSPALQVEVILFIHRHWLAEIWFIKDLDAPVKVRLAMGMEPKVLAPGEVAPRSVLYVVERGKVMFNGRILSKGMCWGDEVILSDKRYFLPCFARAISYTDATQLSQEKLATIVDSYPTSRLALRRATVRLALRRHIVMLAREQRERLHEDPEAARRLSLASAGDFMDRVQDAAAGKMSNDQEASMNIALQLNEHVSHQVTKEIAIGESGGGGEGTRGGGGINAEEAPGGS